MTKDVLKKYTDHELCILIQQKNKSGFDLFYDQYCCLLYGLALKSVKSPEAAVEIVTITFENAWKTIHLYNHRKMKLSVWLVTVFINSTKNYLASKNITYTYNPKNFPSFIFDVVQDKAS